MEKINKNIAQLLLKATRHRNKKKNNKLKVIANNNQLINLAKECKISCLPLYEVISIYVIK